jgi:hypothetical protein
MEICVTNYIRNILQVLDVKHSGKSLMNIKNKNGFKTIRCGTPLSTNVVCYTYFHWFFNPECELIFGKQRGYIFQSPKTIKTWTKKHYTSQHSGKSLMNIKNKNGFKTIRCGTPLSTEVAPSTLTCCDLSERNALIQLSVVPLIPSKLSFESRWCGTLSKAFEKYKIIRSCWIPLSSDMASSCFKDKSCVSQHLF